MNDTAERVEAGDHFVSYHDETLLWKGSPSQWLNFGRYVLWLAVASLGVGLLVYWYFLGGQFQFPQFPELTHLVLFVSAVVIGWSFLMIMINWLRLRCHRIMITQNKILAWEMIKYLRCCIINILAGHQKHGLYQT